MKVLFIGGTGIISSACSQLAVEKGMDLYLLNRGSSERPAPEHCSQIHANIRNKDSVKSALKNLSFDVVVNWIAFTPDHIQNDLDVFRDKTGQYVFISSASVYQTPPEKLPVTEDTPLENPFWQYSRDKIACEELLMREFHNNKFPATIVRPSHTYDKTLLPNHGKWTEIDRMIKGKPVVVHGDGTSIWTLTHHKDFAVGFVGLLGNQRAIGQAFHITSNELLTWNGIFEILANKVNAKADIINIPSAVINQYDAEWGASLLGDKTHSMIFDNRKIRECVPEFNPTIPFAVGASEIIGWYLKKTERQIIDPDYNNMLDKMISDYHTVWNK